MENLKDVDVVLDYTIPCYNRICLEAEIRDYNKQIQKFEFYIAIVLVSFYLVSMILIEVKKVYRSILWRIVLYILISNIFALIYAYNHKAVNTDCDSGSENTVRPTSVILTEFLSFGFTYLFFNLAYWLLFYKYWEVSLT